MEVYARFSREISENGKVLFKKDDGSKKTRYCVVNQDSEKYYIAEKANDTECVNCCTFSKSSEGNMFKLVTE